MSNRTILMDIKAAPVKKIYKSIPLWVDTNLRENGNCFINNKTYKAIKTDLTEFYPGKSIKEKKVEGGFIIWVK